MEFYANVDRGVKIIAVVMDCVLVTIISPLLFLMFVVGKIGSWCGVSLPDDDYDS